ncbi:class I SAM-dependent methyltransferase [soil metagenome]
MVASEYVDWLGVPAGAAWLDVGSGAGGVTKTILDIADPASVEGVDLSPAYVEYARERITDQRASFDVDDAAKLAGKADGSFDAVVSGLVLNFVPEPASAVNSMARAAKPGGTIAAYVWDYAGEMQFMRYFWDAAVELFPEAAPLDEAIRFSICNPEGLTRLWKAAGLGQVETRAIDIPTVFSDFDDFWSPFLGGQGSAPTFVTSLTDADRTALKNLIASHLPFHTDGSIHLIARAWAVRGFKPS